MNGPGPTASLPRVVVFVRDSAWPRSAEAVMHRCIFPETPYEAAAELLAEPADALVADLDALPPAHLQLLEVARRSGTPIILTGKLRAGMDADALSGARLVARNQLVSEIERITVQRSGGGKVTLTPAKIPAARSGPTEEPAAPHPSTLSLDHPVLSPDELSALLEDRP